jgi:hypothetical protein
MISSTMHRGLTPYHGRKSRPVWPRTLGVTLAGCLIAVGALLSQTSRYEIDATRLQAVSVAATAPSNPYGTKDPYGFGPRATAEPGAPGGAADQEDLSIAERPAPRPETGMPESKN